MSAQSAPQPSDDFASRVADAQRQLAESTARAGLKDDPYQLVAAAQSAVIGLFPEMVEHIEASRRPFGPDDLKRLQEAAASGAAGGAQRKAVALARAANWRTLTLGAAVFVASVGGAYWLGRVHEAAQYIQTPAALGVALNGPDAAQWVNLMRLNDLAKAQRDCTAQHGGVGCTFLFWTKPAVAGQ